MNAHQRRQLNRVIKRFEDRVREIAPGVFDKNPPHADELEAHRFTMHSTEVDRIFRRHPKVLIRIRQSMQDFQ